MPPAFEYLIALVKQVVERNSQQAFVERRGRQALRYLDRELERALAAASRDVVERVLEQFFQIHALPLELEAAHLYPRDVEQVID